MPRRLLFVSYTYPPTGGAGVQRTVKFVKYLPRFGWLPSVLTVANPSVPLQDRSLQEDIPPDTVVRRARTLEPGYALKAAVVGEPGGARRGGRVVGLVKAFARRLSTSLLQPDAQVLWLPGAVRAGERLLRELPHDAVLVTGPPFSSFLIGSALARKARLPLVLDYRDEWDISNAYWENRRLGPLGRFVQGRMQHHVVRRASALVATTRSSAESLERVRARAGSRARVSWVYNGFDPADFSGPPPPRPHEPSVYRLAYVGTLWNLTDVTPLVEAVLDLGRREPELARRLELVFAGRRTPAQQQALDRLREAPCRLVQHPYLDHHAALDLIRTADGLCVLLTDGPAAERVVPAKIFEYVATGRPVLALAPPGELWDILRGYPGAHLCRPPDTEGISRALADEVRRHLEGRPAPAGGWDPSPFSRPNQARQLTELLDSLTRGAR